MNTEIGSQLRITNPTPEVVNWVKANLEFANPEFEKKQRMGFWTGDTSEKIRLYEVDGDTLVVPFGCLRSLMSLLTLDTIQTFKDFKKLDFGGNVPLYKYQEEAVDVMYHSHYGILQSPAGSGKTQMGIALAKKFSERTLWLTHTKDLLNQSFSRASQYINPNKLGTITDGLVNIGETMTFATIQTMCRLNLDRYKDVWDVVIVDECHRVSGTPTAVTQFSKVLNALRARHKYGLSATVHRADGMIRATYAYLGNVVYKVPDEAVKNKIMRVKVQPISCSTDISMRFLNTDGTLNYPRLINYLCENSYRNGVITDVICNNMEHSSLILSDRISHLKTICNSLPPYLQSMAVVIDGKTKKTIREQAIEDMRNGHKRFLFATYSLAKEGLDIPRLDRLYMATPQKDYAIVTQAVGRVARTFEGKKQPIVYDFVDYKIKYLAKSYKERCTHYRKSGCLIEDYCY